MVDKPGDNTVKVQVRQKSDIKVKPMNTTKVKVHKKSKSDLSLIQRIKYTKQNMQRKKEKIRRKEQEIRDQEKEIFTITRDIALTERERLQNLYKSGNNSDEVLELLNAVEEKIAELDMILQRY